MKVSLVEPISVSKELIDKLAEKITKNGHEFFYYDRKAVDIEELKERSRDSDIVMIANSPYPDEVIEAAKNLKMISVAFTGIDHVGREACKNKNIMICNSAGYSNQTVAELVIGMAIDALRNVVKANGIVRAGGTSAGIGGREICGKTVGIIGLGKIGMKCAKLFQGFGANVIAYDKNPKTEAEQMGIIYKSLEEVLAEGDIISLNLLLDDSTRGFISKERIALMKPNAVFINCARGPIVDNDALAEALCEGRLGFACVDVFDMEPPIPEEYPLLHAPNTLLTPHQAFISEEAMERRAHIVFENVYAYLDGAPQNIC
ncbi:MAG: 2-hydroxyacid dehydrogenase [Lachnospiraceae bacterium]|nr:2-hydroxyacid dehydrogenase [Lachnospiraceae bacterium]